MATIPEVKIKISGDPKGFAGADTARLERLIKLRRFYELQSKVSERAEIDANKAKNDSILKAESNLQAGIAKLRDLQAKQSKINATEELKGVERLRVALQAAFQASIDGATKAREESKKLLGDADGAKTTGTQKAQDRLDSDKTPGQLDADARPQAEKLRSESNFAAQSAKIAAFQGRLASAKTLADEALLKAGQAEDLSKKILNNRDAATLLQKLGVIKADALTAQSMVKEKEAVELDKTGQGQNKEIEKADERIRTLKADLEKPVTLTMEIAAAELSIKTLQTQLDALKDKTVTVTVETQAPEKQITNLDTGETFSLPRGGFASGGYTGPGGKYQPAGIVHAGEFVLRQEVVRQKGMRSLLDRLNMEGMNALGRKGYANGGMVEGGMTPINLQWPDGTSSRMSADRETADTIVRAFRKAALKAGGRR